MKLPSAEEHVADWLRRYGDHNLEDLCRVYAVGVLEAVRKEIVSDADHAGRQFKEAPSIDLKQMWALRERSIRIQVHRLDEAIRALGSKEK